MHRAYGPLLSSLHVRSLAQHESTASIYAVLVAKTRRARERKWESESEWERESKRARAQNCLGVSRYEEMGHQKSCVSCQKSRTFCLKKKMLHSMSRVQTEDRAHLTLKTLKKYCSKRALSSVCSLPPRLCHTYEWVMSHTWMSHVTHPVCHCSGSSSYK